MKKVKKKSFVAALTAATAISAVPAINSSGAQAAKNEPKGYIGKIDIYEIYDN